MHHLKYILASLCFSFIAISCQPSAAELSASEPTSQPVRNAPLASTANPTQTPITPAASPTTSPSPSAIPTRIPSPTPTPTLTHTPTRTPTPTPTPLCVDRIPSDDDLLAIVTKQYGISSAYEPGDLVFINEHLAYEAHFGFPVQVRQIVLEPLVNMIEAMQVEGMHPWVASGYRSYSAQRIAFDKWLKKSPDRVALLSAPPGHSEHQLGTTIDFGSPELKEIVRDPTVEYHTYFYKTSEGAWLLENAHLYGFTLSYPAEALEVTGFYYEPWHFRFVGVEMATFLWENKLSLTEHQLENNPEPCAPE